MTVALFVYFLIHCMLYYFRKIQTGLGFLDHMFSTLAKHGRFDISLNVSSNSNRLKGVKVEATMLVYRTCLRVGLNYGIRIAYSVARVVEF